MDTILHKLLTGGVGVYPPNPKVVAIMTSSGLGWKSERIAWEISKFMEPAPEFAWLGFPEDFATEWCLALSDGRLTYGETMDLFIRRIQIRRGYMESAIIDDSFLPMEIKGPTWLGVLPDPVPNNRYFRDTVVWDNSLSNKCRVDLTICAIIHMNRIRKVRNVELEKNSGSKFRQPPEIEALFTVERQAQLQALRDIPTSFDLSNHITPETLKLSWPSELPLGGII